MQGAKAPQWLSVAANELQACKFQDFITLWRETLRGHLFWRKLAHRSFDWRVRTESSGIALRRSGKTDGL